MATDNKPNSHQSFKFIFRLVLGLFFFVYLMTGLQNQDSKLNQAIPSLFKSIHGFYDVYLNNYEFIKNPSFEKQIPANGLIPDWSYFGWKIDHLAAADGSNSIATVDTVTASHHSLSQTITFLFLPQSQLKFSFIQMLPSNRVDQKVTLTFRNLDLTKTTIEWQIPNNPSLDWQNLTRTFDIAKMAFQLNLRLETKYQEATPIKVDKLELELLPVQ